MKIRKHNGDESIKLVEVQLEHWELLVKEVCHVELLNYFLHDCVGQALLPHNKEEETSYEVHPLAVVHVLVSYSISFQDVVQVLTLYLFQVVERSVNINFDGIIDEF